MLRNTCMSSCLISRRYDLARVGRYKLNKRLNLQDVVPLAHRTITQHDIVQWSPHDPHQQWPGRSR
jgi:hypothetical protein